MKVICCACFRTLSTRQRFKIFEFLKKKPKVNVTTLVNLTGLRQPTVSFHINQLLKRGIIKKYKDGRNVYCQVIQKCRSCPLFSKTSFAS